MNRQTDHHHHHAVPDYNRAFAVGVGLNLAFVGVEAFYGVMAGSLALLTDAGHNLSDVFGLLLAWGANALAQRKPSSRRTYGYSRATILASLASGLLLLAAVGAITWEAIGRFMEPALPSGKVMIVVAGIGVVINTVTALFFFSGKDKDLNIRGAYLHMAADAAVSLGVVVSGVVILKFGFAWVDPVISLVIAAVIFLSTWDLMRDSANLAVDAVPRNVDPDVVRNFLLGLPGVAGVHDLHIWAMSTTDTALTAHLVMPDPPGNDAFLHEVTEMLHHDHGINHATIQIERGDAETDCHQARNCAD
ncbi:MAG: cation transporter [Xanthomonadales bacterium]|nr:cation diffusion facilitator family transporter [Gammaproteobacteria bacterium]NNE05655.1 cation transporter [Xanthomonadales bacterium]NNL96172.1 cation transporter [Xanthomonadales bacterium]